MSNELNLGSLITTPQKRDAIHVAITPVIVNDGETMYPGQHVGLVKNSVTHVTGKGNSNKHLGVIDPYLKHPLFGDQTCWLFLYPQTVTGLRHDWTHPAFPATVENQPVPVVPPTPPVGTESKVYIQSFADEVGISYEEMMEAAHDYLANGEYLVQGHRFMSQDVPDAFWDHYEVVTSSKVTKDQRGTFFSCSC